METKPKLNQPSDPKDFFARLYGHLENSSGSENSAKNGCDSVGEMPETQTVVAPVPVLAAPLPFFLPHASDAHLSVAAAAGLSAFCKFIIFLLNREYSVLVTIDAQKYNNSTKKLSFQHVYYTCNILYT